MLNNLEIWITEKCNSRCLICHWWKKRNNENEISVEDIKILLSKKEFIHVKSAQISGGEPMMRSDINEAAGCIINSLPNLNKLTITTNGSFPEKTKQLLRYIKTRSSVELKLCVSIEGNREVHKKIRGIDNYDKALATLMKCRKAIPGLRTTILTTLTKYNCNYDSLGRVRELAQKTNSAFSYRMYYNSNAHHRVKNNDVKVFDTEKKNIINFTERYFQKDPFLAAQAVFLATGKMPLMDKCEAGLLFANIRSDGGIYPCINSTRKIGDSDNGIYTKRISNLGKYELCPCCDEACFYPMYHNEVRNKK